MPSLDELLGRQSLKDRIDELEEECDRLESQLEAEADRRRDAVRGRQSAEERVNTLEDRVAGLEGELEEREGDTEPAWAHVTQLRIDEVEAVLGTLESVEADPETLLTASVHATPTGPVRDVLEDAAGLIGRAAPCLCFVDEHRIIRAIVAPPRPPDPFQRWASTFKLDRSWFLPEANLTFALVRSDLFAIGRVDDASIAFRNGFGSDVIGRHSKGGFSQSRFERRRQEQIDEHLERCRTALASADGPRILVGDRGAIGRLSDLATATGLVDASGSPEEALARAFRDYWTSKLYIP